MVICHIGNGEDINSFGVSWSRIYFKILNCAGVDKVIPTHMFPKSSFQISNFKLFNSRMSTLRTRYDQKVMGIFEFHRLIHQMVHMFLTYGTSVLVWFFRFQKKMDQRIKFCLKMNEMLNVAVGQWYKLQTFQ